MSFALYTLGLVIMLAGIIWGAHMMHVPAGWIGVGTVVLLGIGIFTAVKNTRQKDPS
jgi:hypothetical protein